ncbi:hypothetical protein SAMN05216503_2010 [Polaribacter sp. KT25b]|uniref:hypothetical protein n=1 Tax=Polaribacter sp. KT25b TaxID=1855336 RepID=UPI00087D4A8D|nr:hypothetical protein [Polaribacter sp. KT25b]SDS11140.1 hypothetical protein SAMN05216503_2010 [Polaribacter sp. KT25b]
MKKTLYTFLLTLISYNIYAQNHIVNENDIPKLNSIIKSLEKEFNGNETPTYKSLPHTSANYFKIITNKPNDFLNSLDNAENFEQLIKENPTLQIDRDLLIIKNVGFNYKKEKKIEVKSFEIGQSQRHLIEIKYSDSLNNSNIKFLYSIHKETWSDYKDASIIQGFYLINKFKSINIPEKYTNWIHYTDIIVKPETSIFYDNKEKSSGLRSYKKTIIDSLVSYYETKTNKPPYRKEQDFIARRKELDKWQSKKQKFSDSLYKTDKHFKKLLIEALSYAEENKVSNGDLEDFTSQLISKNRALELMRQNRQVGSCSFDNGPVIQQKRIAALAAQNQNWEVFIQSFLNVMNDNVTRNANSNIASNARNTYIEELAKLDLDIDKILLGSNLRIQDTVQKHYFSDGSKIAKAYANLDSENQHYFEKTISDIISDKSIDAFNKLHFYNTYRSYQYFLKDSLKKNEADKNIEKLIPLLPNEIKSRIENPNKQLYDLLYREKNELDEFEIKSSIIANIYSYSYGGDCWQAELIEKGSNGKIIYDLTMAIGEEITPFQNFLYKKDELTSRVISHSFLQEILNENSENKLYVKFTNDKSFANYRNKVTEEIPEELTSALDFNNAISLYISFPNRKYVRFILLGNGNLLTLGIPKDFELPGYKFEELMTKEEKSFLSTSYKSFKLFDNKGKMLN